MSRPASTSPTNLQQKIYDYIVAFKSKHDGNSPTIREIGDFAGISSSSVTNYHLRLLARLGLIDFRPQGRSRMITIIGGAWLPPTSAGK